ncbi:MAG: response regulator [Ruminococcus sp.]|nr:response regulator [Ruminococcus sp.]
MEFLLVDDNEITLEIQRMMLESCGLNVVTADCGQAAVRIAGEKQFFLIFMDIRMPHMNGFQAAELIRKNDKTTPIIALSADRIDPDDPQFKRSEMNGALLKPLQMSDLEELLEKYLALELPESSEKTDPDLLFAYEELLAVMKNERAVMRLLDRFLNVHGNDCSNLRDCVWNGNYQGAREILHNIIGISGNMFCKRLYRIACTLGSELRQNSCESLDIFSGIWQDTIEEVARRRSALSETAAENAPEMNWQELREKFFALCEDFDTYAAELFYENIRCFEKNMAASEFERLKKAIMAYDFLEIISNREVCVNV